MMNDELRALAKRDLATIHDVTADGGLWVKICEWMEAEAGMAAGDAAEVIDQHIKERASAILALLDANTAMVAALQEIERRSTPAKHCTPADTARDLFHCHSIARAALALAERQP